MHIKLSKLRTSASPSSPIASGKTVITPWRPAPQCKYGRPAPRCKYGRPTSGGR